MILQNMFNFIKTNLSLEALMKYFYIFLLILSNSFVCLDISAQDKKKEPSVTLTISSSSKLNLNVVDKKITVKEQDKSISKNEKKEPPALSPISLDNIWDGFKNWVHSYIKYERFSMWDIISLFLGILLTLIVARIARWIVETQLKRFASKTKNKVDDLIFEAIGKPISLLIISIGIYCSAWPITELVEPALKHIFARLCLALAAASIAWGIYQLIEVIDYSLKLLAKKTDNNLDDLIVNIIRKSLKVTITLLSILFIGQNILNLNITTLLAGAGVFGLAIAFAAQDTIANFFGSIMIILDQPFKVGDTINVNGYKGGIENIGFRSTRLRTFDGHLVSIPNKNVANANIENIAKRPFIKHSFNLGLTYDTGYKNMEKAIKILHDLLDPQKCNDVARPPRITFNSFNDCSLNINVTIWWHHRDDKEEITLPDYGVHVMWVHETYMEVLKQFDAEGLEFAFPTNTTYLAQDDKRKVSISVDQSKIK
jgi:MscS family membrane protein